MLIDHFAIAIVLLVDRVWKLKYHIEVAKPLNGSVPTVRPDIEAMRCIRSCVPEISIQSLGDCLVAG